MARHIVLAVLWGLAVWTCVATAHAFLGTLDVSPLAATLVAAGILAHGLVTRARVEQRTSAQAFAPKAS